MATKSKKLKTALKSVDRFKVTGTDVATELSDIYTIITNISGSTLTFGFLPPHGKELANGESVTIPGDFDSQLKTGGGRDWKRKVTGYENAKTDLLIKVEKQYAQIVYCAVDSGTVIAVGDMVFLDTDDVKPASSFTWDTNLATTQASFANAFLGIAMSSHASGSAVTNFPVNISPHATYKMTCASATFEIGATLGPAKASGNALENQKLVAAVAASSVARCRKRHASASTTVVANFQSAYWGANAAAQQ